jgi:predicted DNA-binding transcriptional regulator AlpA
MLPLLDLNDLSRALKRSPETIKRDLRRNPHAVPPRLQLPGTKLLRWREEDVVAWLQALADASTIENAGRQ